jgi:hypothetical protein
MATIELPLVASKILPVPVPVGALPHATLHFLLVLRRRTGRVRTVIYSSLCTSYLYTICQLANSRLRGLAGRNRIGRLEDFWKGEQSMQEPLIIHGDDDASGGTCGARVIGDFLHVDVQDARNLQLRCSR